MIKITNGSQHLEVTRGAFISMFAPLGYVVVGAHTDDTVSEVAEVIATGVEGKTTTTETEVPETKTPEGADTEPPAEGDTGESPEVPEDPEEEEKPLSEMTLSELKTAAAKLGIPANGLRSKQEAIEAINSTR